MLIEAAIDQVEPNGKVMDPAAARTELKITAETGPAGIDHVPDGQHHYPGDLVNLYTRLTVRQPLADVMVRVALPEGTELEEFQPPPALPELQPALEVDGEAGYLAWHLPGMLPAGTQYEFRAGLRIGPVLRDKTLASRAVVSTPDQAVLADELAMLHVWAKGKYLHYLPEIYEQDELMGRFLMLFESFWAPINRQAGAIHNYLDPRLTPAAFLSWLASWLDLELDERWPEDRQRQLIRWAIALHRSRGTRWGLQKYLEIFTGHKARIVEHRAKNFQLGSGASLGRGIALGRDNRPHTFTIHLRLPAFDHIEDEVERDRQEKLRRATIESIIEMQKPAHTVYTLHLELVPSAEMAAGDQPDELDVQASTWFHLDS